MPFVFSLEFARQQDTRDPLSSYRNQFIFPHHNGREAIYFTGNSLGLQPQAARKALETELEDWAAHGVEGHFEARHPWYSYHELFAAPLAAVVGAKPSEVVAMNGLTVNLHLLMASFYRPEGKRTKILCEGKAFPSDQYALASQAQLHGLDPKETVVEMHPREGEHLLRTEDILETIAALGDELACIMIGGVNYYTGQYFDLAAITEAGHRVGARVGFDLAHAAGNVPVQLHDWGVDFACWCSYKYLNSGPGSVAGAFVHERHHQADLVRLAGWWGHDKEERFRMEPEFKPMPSAEAWQLSNAPVFSMAVHQAALSLHTEAGMARLREKSLQLTAYLEFVIGAVAERHGAVTFEVITPSDPEQRGCQLSILAHGQGRPLFDRLTARGVVADWREPNVIRIAPVPMYNSFEDVFRFGEALEAALTE